MALPDHDRYCDELLTQTGRLRELLTGADPATDVPTCPGWTLADLVRHIGGNLRTVGTAVRTGEPVDDPERQVPDLAGPQGDAADARDAWLGDAAEDFARTLRAAGPDGEAQVWGLTASTGFWARRAAHDVVIHRADAAAALSAEYSVAPEVATDVLDELLEMMSAPGATPRLAEPRGDVGTSIHLHATDARPELNAEWLIELGDSGFTWHRGHDKAAVALRGPLADVLRVFYRRLPAGSARVEVLGQGALLDYWLERVSLG
jgi:uncharacterized protein (TIGR03083 family)